MDEENAWQGRQHFKEILCLFLKHLKNKVDWKHLI